MLGLLWLAFIVFALLWILGLVFTWGGWVWILFAIGLVLLVTNVASAYTARRR
jgi:hypothetical protein